MSIENGRRALECPKCHSFFEFQESACGFFCPDCKGPIRPILQKVILDKEAYMKDRIASLEAELVEAKKCNFCGSTDLVCGKGWKEERDKLKAENAKLKKEAKEARIKGVKDMVRICDLTEALRKIADKCANGPEEFCIGYCKIAQAALSGEKEGKENV